ncbi:hypothetical protein ZHAS_00017702 [Anopheles sinensis]|uniref:Uncharacterized protein n=1 Tax=Anopheles sinensis TaxID=74873 RepID=A0A084WH06_ANOSI|nr:hypothetical protein ZHAS_00017702 [Anopheles sinensis]
MIASPPSACPVGGKDLEGMRLHTRGMQADFHPNWHHDPPTPPPPPSGITPRAYRTKRSSSQALECPCFEEPKITRQLLVRDPLSFVVVCRPLSRDSIFPPRPNAIGGERRARARSLA